VNKVPQLQCDCGFETRAEDEDGLVAEIRRHAREAHGMALTHDEALVLAFRVLLDANTSAVTPHDRAAREREEEK
jgi:predicted small metal-binding protein